jgi:ATP-dependent Clp protease adapter protein ClpS
MKGFFQKSRGGNMKITRDRPSIKERKFVIIIRQDDLTPPPTASKTIYIEDKVSADEVLTYVLSKLFGENNGKIKVK